MQLVNTQRGLYAWKSKATLFLLCSYVLRGAGAMRISSRQEGEEPAGFDWSLIEPSTELNWVPCYTEPLRCTRLEVPLNYTAESDSEGTAAIALVSYPSPLNGTSSYQGPVLFNPGGPGGSGVSYVVESGAYFQEIFGEEFDIVGFDPRGVGETTPTLTYPGTPEEAAIFSVEFPSALDLSEERVDTLPERMAYIKEWAELNKREREGTLRYMTTDLVARDMLSIMRAHGQERLRYWGLSYGSALGSVYASLFPDNVERMIIDGVLDQEGYYNNDWTLNIIDADKALEWFFSTCASAGPSRCAFHAPTLEGVRARYHTVEHIIATSNLTFPPEAPIFHFDTKVLQATVHSLLYRPTNFPALAEGLAAIEREKDLSVMLGNLGHVAGLDVYSVFALRCTDTREVRDGGEELMEYARRVRGNSEYLSRAVESVRMSCAGWDIHPGNFQGPMGGNTSFPILFTGNSADGATPLLGAQQTSANFPGSRVLTYDIPGHGTLAFRNNPCIHKTYRNYMLNGTLPEEGAVCEEDREFFPDPEDSELRKEGLGPLADMGAELVFGSY